MRAVKTGPKIAPVADRFWPKVNKSGPTIRAELGSCWVWTASRDRSGYGKFGRGRLRGWTKASRVSWELAHGAIPNGLWVLHRCDNPPCVNPGHLFLGTARDNNRDTAAKGRFDAQKNPAKYRAYLAKGRAVSAAKAAARPDPTCIHCERPVRRRRWAGRCHACHEYFRRNGVDRDPLLLAGVRPRGERAANAKLTEANVREIFRRVAEGERQTDLCRAFGVARCVVNNIIAGRSWKHLGLSSRSA